MYHYSLSKNTQCLVSLELLFTLDKSSGKLDTGAFLIHSGMSNTYHVLAISVPVLLMLIFSNC